MPMRPSLRRNGFGLLELVCALIIVGIFWGIVIIRRQENPTNTSEMAARIFLRAMDAARSEAVLQQKDARMYVDTLARPARILAVVKPVGMDTTAVDSARWLTLPYGVRFGAGAAAYGPQGDTITTAVPQTTVVCNPTGDCDLGGAPLITYYLTHEKEPGIIQAVTISMSGAMRIYRYDPRTMTWK